MRTGLPVETLGTEHRMPQQDTFAAAKLRRVEAPHAVQPYRGGDELYCRVCSVEVEWDALMGWHHSEVELAALRKMAGRE